MKSLKRVLTPVVLGLAFVVGQVASLSAQGVADVMASVRYNTTEIDGVEVFYREAGSRDNPTVLLLHGFPQTRYT